MDIRCTQSIYPSAGGSEPISYSIFRPVDVPLRGVIQISHSMCDYFTRYIPFARYFCAQGFIVCGNDHLGHGSSVSPSGSYGFFGHKNGWSVLVDDLAALTVRIKRRWPDLPYFLVGHAMGANLARLYLERYGDWLNGCIFCSPPASSSATLLRIQLANSVIRSHGPMYRSVLLNKLAMGNYNRRIPDSDSPFDWLSRDKAAVRQYQLDPKCNFIFTAAGFRDLFYLELECSRSSLLHRTPKHVPLLFLAGDADPISHYGSAARRLAAAYRSAGSKDVTAVLYPGARSELLHELNRGEVCQDICSWLELHLPEEALEE